MTREPNGVIDSPPCFRNWIDHLLTLCITEKAFGLDNFGRILLR